MKKSQEDQEMGSQIQKIFEKRMQDIKTLKWYRRKQQKTRKCNEKTKQGPKL